MTLNKLSSLRETHFFMTWYEARLVVFLGCGRCRTCFFF